MLYSGIANIARKQANNQDPPFLLSSLHSSIHSFAHPFQLLQSLPIHSSNPIQSNPSYLPPSLPYPARVLVRVHPPCRTFMYPPPCKPHQPPQPHAPRGRLLTSASPRTHFPNSLTPTVQTQQAQISPPYRQGTISITQKKKSGAVQYFLLTSTLED